MTRRILFLGLTLLLLVALISLIIRGRQQEKEQGNKPAEVIRDSQTTPTRVLNPTDLEIIQPLLKPGRKSGTANFSASGQEIEIRNAGTLPYNEIGLRLTCLGRSGKVLTIKTQSIANTIAPGTSLKLTEISPGDIPPAAAACRATIAYADIGEASPGKSEKQSVADPADSANAK
jgi:hypothetical protein